MKNQCDEQTSRTLTVELESERKLQLLANDIEMALLNVFPDSATFKQKINFVYEIAALFTEAGLPFGLHRGEAWVAERGKGELEKVEGHEWIEVHTCFGTIIVDPTLRCKLMDVWEEGIDFDMPTVMTPKQAQAIVRGYEGDTESLEAYAFGTNTDDAERALPDVKSLVHLYANVLGRSVAA